MVAVVRRGRRNGADVERLTADQQQMPAPSGKNALHRRCASGDTAGESLAGREGSGR